MAQPTISLEQITKTNQRLFDKYASVFTSPESTEDFVVHAQKLADWLSDFKAYYHAARPQIVKLLLTAHKTICTSLNVAPTSFHVSQYPHDVKVQAYANLVRTVEPFKNYFQQHPAHIQFLMSTIQSPPHPFVIPNQTTAVNQQHFNSGPSNSGIPAPTPIEHDPEVVIIDKPPNFQDRPAKKDAQSVPVPTMNPNATVKSTRPKVKKRKTIDFNLLVEEDIKGLQEKKAALPSGLQPDEGNAMDSAFSTSTMQDALVSVQGPEPTTTTLVDDIDRKEDQLTRFDPTSVVSQPLSSELQLLPEPQLFSDSQPLPEPEPLPGSQPLPDSQSLPDSLGPQLQPQNLRESQPLAEYQHPPEPQPLPKPQLPLEIQHPLESHQPLESYPPSEPCPPSESHLPLESHPPSELLHSESPPEKFGPSIHIVARQDGLAYQGRMTVCFNVSDSTYAKISNWVKVNRDPNEIIPINSCICFSFGCYLTSDLKKNPDDTALENQVRSTSTTWPPAGSLSMKVQFKGSEESIPLSPPIKVTPNALVDMCPFIICGENSIDIAQKEDLSQYTFVLYVHWPSAEQLAQVRQNRKKEQDWKKWMLEVTRPLKVPSVDYRQAV